MHLHTSTHAHTGHREKHIRKKEYTIKVRCMGAEEWNTGLQFNGELYLISFHLGLLKSERRLAVSTPGWTQ